MSWNGTAMSYDAIGNMLTKGDISYSWTLGRKLSGVNNGKNIRYEYDHTGARIRKTVDNNVTEYRLAGDLLVAEVTNGKKTSFVYDSGADLVAMIYEGKYYFYVKNLQGDIVSIVDESGTAIVNYSYDSWGRLLQIEGSKKDTIGILNPFRYRDYYYDTETGMYYLENRYYDPEIRRFICVDKYVSGVSILANMYLYCGNNPVNRFDPDGHLFRSLIRGAKRIYKSVASKVNKVWRSVTRYVQKKVNVRVSSSYSTRQKTSVRGIYNASCTHTTRSSASTNKNAGISIWANYGGMTTYDASFKNPQPTKKTEVGISVNTKAVNGSCSTVNIAGESFGVRSTFGNGTYSGYSGCSITPKDLSVDVTIGYSYTNKNTTNSVEYTVGVGIYTIALSLAGGIAAGIGEVVQEAIGVIGVFA